MVDARTPVRRVIPDKPPKINEKLFLEACAAKGAVTAEDRARLLGMPRRSLRRYVEGEHTPLLPTAQHIADRLDVTVDALWPRRAA